MNKNAVDIVIAVGTAAGSGLELARSIKRQVNCRSFILCTDSKTSKTYELSRYVDEVYQVSNSSKEQYIHEMKHWYSKQNFSQKPLFYFTTDTACFYIDSDRTWFEQHFILCLPSSKIIQTYTKKGVAEEHASRNGLTVPKTKVINNISDVEHVAKTFLFPIILKPQATYLKGNIDFKIKVIDDPIEFNIEVKDLIKEKNNSVICQEFIPGDDNTSYYYLFYRSENGIVYENMGRKVLQSTPKGGIMLKGLVEYNELLSKESREFLNKIDYKGIGGIEFKKYKDRFYFIEMSTRLEGFFKIAEVSNVPLSLYSYYDLTNNFLELENFKDIKQRDKIIYMDLISTLLNRIKYRKGKALINDFFNAVYNPKVHLNVYAKDDQRPFWFMVKKLIFK